MILKKYFQKIVVYVCQRFNLSEAEEVFDKVQVFLTILLQLAFVIAFVIAIYKGLWAVAFLSVAGMISMWLPVQFARKRRIHIPISFEFFFTLFVYASLFMGEIQSFYTKFWWWDMFVHTASGIGLGFVGFLIIYSLYQKGPLDIEARLLALFSFCFALSLGALWEIFEFIMDNFFAWEMQKNGLTDTMGDLIMDTIGAFIISVSGYFYIKYKKDKGIFHYYLTSYLKKSLGK